MVRKLVLIVLTLILLASCASAPQRAQRQLSKALDHLKRAQELDPSITLTRIDTVTKEVYIPKVSTDSIFVAKQGDTVVIHKDRLTVKYVKLAGDTTYIEGECAADTVYVKIPVKSDIVIKRESYKDIVKRVLGLNNLEFWVLHVMIALFALAFVYIKFIKPKFL